MSGRGDEQSIYRYLMLTINILTKLTQTHTDIQNTTRIKSHSCTQRKEERGKGKTGMLLAGAKN